MPVRLDSISTLAAGNHALKQPFGPDDRSGDRLCLFSKLDSLEQFFSNYCLVLAWILLAVETDFAQIELTVQNISDRVGCKIASFVSGSMAL